IFDGFDELDVSRVDNVEREILRLAEQTPNVVIVSSRNDERFNAWGQFLVFKVEPLDKKQVLQLISRIDFDSPIKRKFSDRVRKDLFESHKDFMSRPLLAMMMLLTYSAFADVPDRVHVFYDQAFDTLFSRHDATKEAFKRKRHSDLSIDDFKRAFGFFSLLTYLGQITEFSESSVLEYAKNANVIAKTKCNGEDFYNDLVSSVCVLQRDGLTISFSHRSFQEYFGAYALMRLNRDQCTAIIPRLAGRFQDNVLPMLFEMNISTLEDCYIYPYADKVGALLDGVTEKTELAEIVTHLGLTIGVQKITISRKGAENLKDSKRSAQYLIQSIGGNDIFEYLYWNSRLYDTTMGNIFGFYATDV